RREALPSFQGGRVGTGHHRAATAHERRGQQRAAVDPRARNRAALPRARRARRAPVRHAAAILALVSLGMVQGLPAAPGDITFTDVTRQAGIRFVHNSGRAGQKWLPETLGSGVAFFDAAGAGWTDLLFVNSRDWQPTGRRSLSALYRNDGRGGFRDITAGSGLDVQLYGMGVAVGDYDNDGRG